MKRLLLIAALAATTALAQEPGSAEADLLDPGRATGSARRTLYKVQMQRSRGENEEARRTLREHLAEHPDDDHALLRYHLGQVLALGDSMAAAADQFEAAVTLEPGLLPAWRNLGEVAYGLAEYDRAARAFGAAWPLDPERDPRLRYYQGVALLQADRPAEAVTVLADLVADPGPEAPVDWYQALLAAAVEAENPAAAGPAMSRLTTLRPGDPEAWYLAYQQASAAGNYAVAVRNLTVTGFLRPLTLDERRQLGDLSLAAGAPARAVMHFTAVVDSLGSEDPADLDRLVSALLEADRAAEAIAVLDRRLDLAPTVQGWRLKGELHYGREEWGAAREAFAAASRLDPAEGELELLQGYCLLEMGDHAAARRHLVRAGEDPALASRAREGLAYLEARIADK